MIKAQMLTHYKTEIFSHSLNSINRIFGIFTTLSAFQRNNLLSKRDIKIAKKQWLWTAYVRFQTDRPKASV